MTSFVGSLIDPTMSGVTEPHDVGTCRLVNDAGQCEEGIAKTQCTFDPLPILVEAPTDVHSPDDFPNGVGADMLRVNENKPRTPRPGRKYKAAQIQSYTNGYHQQQKYPSGVDSSIGWSSSSSLSSPRDWQSSLRDGSSSSGTSWNSSFACPKIPASPRSPRLPRRLPSITRSASEDSSTISPRDNENQADNDESDGGTMIARGLKGETLNDDDDDDEVFSANNLFHHIPLPTSSTVFQKVMTDFNERRHDSSSSIDSIGPGDLMVRRSSLARTTIGSPPLLPINDLPDDEQNITSELSLDIELVRLNNGKDEREIENEESGPKVQENVNHQRNEEKTGSTERVRKVSKENSSKGNHKKTSPRRHIKFPVENNLPTCSIDDDNSAPKPGIVINVPTEDSLNPTASHSNRDQRKTRLRFCDVARSVSGESHTTGSSDTSTGSPERSPNSRRRISNITAPSELSVGCPGRATTPRRKNSHTTAPSQGSSGSPERSPNPRRKISHTLSLFESSEGSMERSPTPRRKISDNSLINRPITPARSQHGNEPVIDMKTAGNIIRFITAAAASSKAPGLNRNQQLLPSDVRLPVVDPSGRLLHRNRDESMRLVKQAVDNNVEGEEKSDVYSWDELRDCRYLRTKKNSRGSRRNSLLGFNEV